MASFVTLRAIYRPATATDQADFILAALPPNPDAPVDTDSVNTWAYDDHEAKWNADDVAPESDMTRVTLRHVRFHLPSGKISPKAQLEQVYMCMRLFEAHFVAANIAGSVRVGTPREVHPSIMIAFAIPDDANGPGGEEVLNVSLPDVLECFLDRPDDAALGRCVALLASRPVPRVTRAGAQRQAVLVVVPAAPAGVPPPPPPPLPQPPRPAVQKQPPGPMMANKAPVHPPPAVPKGPPAVAIYKAPHAPPPPPPPGPDVDGSDDGLLGDANGDQDDTLQDDANPWAYNALRAPLKIDATYEITYMFEGTRHVRTAKAIATDRIRFMDGNCVETAYPPEASGTTQMTHKMISDAWTCRNRKTGIDPEDIATWLPFIDSEETREILQQRLEKKFKVDGGVGSERRMALIHQVMRWAKRHATKPTDELSLDEGRDFVYELQMSFYSAQEDVPEHVLRTEMESIGKGATQIARAVASVRTNRAQRKQKDGKKRQAQAPPPKDRIPGTCDKCHVKGHIAKNCPSGNGAGGAHPKSS